MNRYARGIVREFTSRENKEFLHKSLSEFFNHPKVFRFLEDQLDNNMENFAGVIEQELSVSDPMPGMGTLDQLNCFNNQFIKTRIDFIKTHVLMVDEHVPLYAVNDGLPTSRHSIRHYQRDPNYILKTWLGNSGRSVQAREDTAGDVDFANPFYGSGHQMATGITFCDQSAIGTQNHVEQYENTLYKQALNRNQGHESTVFGVSTPSADARLLSRRIFRRNEAGSENGIPRYEARLYNRFLERDVAESLSGTERDCIVHGYDMSSIHKRLDHKQKV